MKPLYASVIVEISSKALDRTFQYAVPECMTDQIELGSCVTIPFGPGGRLVRGYVTDFSNSPEISKERIKEISSLERSDLSVETQLVKLAGWMKQHYGCTMIQALNTVMPVKEMVKPPAGREIICLLSPEELDRQTEFCEKKHQTARARLLSALREDQRLPYSIALNRLNLSAATLKAMEEAGWIRVDEIHKSLVPLAFRDTPDRCRVRLNEEQDRTVRRFREEFLAGRQRTYLLYGITGSGKTEVYIEMIDCVLSAGKQAIVLIPEIALTYQTVMRFYRRFGDRVAMVNSRMSKGERYEQFCRARSGAASIMIGPRSALFTPFPNLGLIIMDEEHEHSYKSENVPRYHAKDVAAVRCSLSSASLVLGSATPSVSDYYRAKQGEYELLTLSKRASAGSCLPETEIIDLRDELKAGNKQIFSRRLIELMSERLEKHEQIMLFLNRRGYSGFLSCRSCGKAVKCAHCDVAMTVHQNNKMICHYCGSTKIVPKVCPSCGSPYLAGFGVGTEKVEMLVRELFPQARVLRMDMDTTSRKGSHEAILSAFSRHEADILVGTQMIVKGHDFPMVTLVGVLAADLSLFSQDYRADADTFSLLTQAAGRAGRSIRRGRVIIQTYNPDHYAVVQAAKQDYPGFYEEEILYRKVLGYPPYSSMLTIQYMSSDEQLILKGLLELKGIAAGIVRTNGWQMEILGPADGNISKVKDIYRKVLYIKAADEKQLERMREMLEANVRPDKRIQIQYDWNED